VALTDLDRNLLKRCFAGEPGAWRDFVDRFIGLLIHVINHTAHARSVKVRREDVDDLCSEVFLAILADDFAVLRRFRGKSSLATYLAVVSRRIVVREISRRRMAEAFGHVDAHHSSIEQAEADVADFRRHEDSEEIEVLLKDLPERDASIVRAHYLDGKSYDDISRDFEVPVNSIGSIISRAKEKLRHGQVSP